MNPIGKVKAGAAIWRARTDGPPISEGEKVSVLGITGLTMIVGREFSEPADQL
ncbi:MAG: NfeD family protein [Candidatus Thorarchaeota archaeon]